MAWNLRRIGRGLELVLEGEEGELSGPNTLVGGQALKERRGEGESFVSPASGVIKRAGFACDFSRFLQ